MNALKRFLAGTAVTAAVAFAVNPPIAQATFINDFDRMTLVQKNDLVDFLLNGTVDYLNNSKRSEDANRMVALFTPDAKGHSKGADEFDKALQMGRELEKEHKVDAKGNIVHSRVESALSLVLEEADIKVPIKVLLNLGEQFRQQNTVLTKQPAATQPSPTTPVAVLAPSQP